MTAEVITLVLSYILHTIGLRMNRAKMICEAEATIKMLCDGLHTINKLTINVYTSFVVTFMGE